jgi:hypothetical protein
LTASYALNGGSGGSVGNFVPYVGTTSSVDLGVYSITASNTLKISSTEPSLPSDGTLWYDLSDTSSVTIPFTASYALTASYAMNGGGGGSGSGVSSSYADTSSIVVFNGNRTIKRSGYTGTNVGGADVVAFLNNFFFPFLPATVAIAGGTTYYETGTNVDFSIASTITANDEVTFGTASILRDGTTWTSSTAPPSPFTSTDHITSSNHSYITYVQTDNNGSPTVISSNTRTISFIYPYLYGMSTTAGLSGTSLYNTFTKQVVTSGNKTVSLIGNATYIYFAYPTSYPALTSILDPNSFEVISNFEYSSSVSVTSTGLNSNWTNTYRVYRTTLVSDPNGNYQFKQ